MDKYLKILKLASYFESEADTPQPIKFIDLRDLSKRKEELEYKEDLESEYELEENYDKEYVEQISSDEISELEEIRSLEENMNMEIAKAAELHPIMIESESWEDYCKQEAFKKYPVLEKLRSCIAWDDVLSEVLGVTEGYYYDLGMYVPQEKLLF